MKLWNLIRSIEGSFTWHRVKLMGATRSQAQTAIHFLWKMGEIRKLKAGERGRFSNRPSLWVNKWWLNSKQTN